MDTIMIFNDEFKQYFRNKSKNWFTDRYDVIEYKRVKNHIEMGGVTTIPDECREVGRVLSPVEAHRIANSYEEIV